MMNRSSLTRAGRAVPGGLATTLSVMLVASLMAGCSFSWDSSGIRDVLLGGRKPSEIKPQSGDQTATNADTSMETSQAGPPPKTAEKEEDLDAEHRLRKVAVLPMAYIDASGGQPCDLCPAEVQMKPTSPSSARLITGFIYEAIASHPRLLFPTPETVDKAVAAAPAHSLRQTAAQLAAAGRAELVIVSALVELRQRVGPDDAPTTPAGITLYVALVNASSGEIQWSDTFNEDESGRNFLMRGYDKLMNDKPVRWSTAEGFGEYAVDELIEDLVGEIDTGSGGWWDFF
jgi:hypothetical protein